jgi:hypothetical protein
MPIKGIFWYGNTGRDIHVLRGGVTRDLISESLRFDDGTPPRDGMPRGVFAEKYLVDVADVTLTFTPLFKHSPQGDDFVGDQNGITVSKTTGVVTVKPAIGINVKHNFIIEVEAKNDGDARVFHEKIRVHVHGSIDQVWLTPDRLTLRPIDDFGPLIHTIYRFSVRAQFDDGTIGDLTDGHGVTWAAPGGHIDPATGKLTLQPTDTDGLTFPVTATLPTLLGGASTPAAPMVRIASGFVRQATPPDLTMVAGGAMPGPTAVEEGLNVLLVSDGFLQSDAASFDRIADRFVHHLKTNQLTKPFNLLAGRMNFWKLFIPAEQAGISISTEVYLQGIHPYAKAIPPALKPPADPPAPQPPASWQLPHLIYAVGLPVPGDEGRTAALLKQKWATLLQTDPSSHIGDDVVNEWKKMAKRTLLDERDGFPGLSMGATPAASERDTRFLHMHPQRVGIQMLRRVLATLGSTSATLSDGRNVGLLWKDESTAVSATTDAAGYAMGATTITLAAAGTGEIVAGDSISFDGDPNRYVVEGGEDDVSDGGSIELAAPGLRQALPASPVAITVRPFAFRNGDFVVVISAVPGGRAANTPGTRQYIAIGTDKGDTFPVKAVPGRNAFALDFAAAPADIEATIARTLAHELGHSMGLGDEYIEFDEPFSEVGSRPFANLQIEKDAQVPDPADPTKRVLDGDEIQWRWHRITAAAVVNGDIAADPGGLDRFRIPVAPDVSFRFAVGDTLRLRARARGEYLKKLAPLDVSGDLIIVEPPERDAVVVRVVHAISAQAFPAGSLLYAPKAAPVSVLSPAYPYAEMVAKNIKDAITANRKPLLDDPGPNNLPQVPMVDTEDGRTPVANLHVDPEDLPRIVGLYAGGGQFVSGIFHPMGLCMMRNNLDAHAEFCAVCRYVMVDLVAPDFHPEIDADYDKVYPQK